MPEVRDLQAVVQRLGQLRRRAPDGIQVGVDEFLFLVLYAASKTNLYGLSQLEIDALYKQYGADWGLTGKKIWSKALDRLIAEKPPRIKRLVIPGQADKHYRLPSTAKVLRKIFEFAPWLKSSRSRRPKQAQGVESADSIAASSFSTFTFASFVVSTTEITLELDTEHELPQFNVRVLAPIDITGVSLIEQSKDPKLEHWTEMLNWDDVIFYFQSGKESNKRRRLKDITGLRFYKHLGGGKFEVILYRILKGPVDAAQLNPASLIH